MIYTVTFNPSLDYIVQVEDFQLGKVNRTTSEFMSPGGKGINVSILLKNLGIDSCALGFLAGFTGKEIEDRIIRMGVSSRLITVKNGISRINVKLKSREESEINGMGPLIEKEDVEQLFLFLQSLTKEDILVLAGSIPASIPKTIYQEIMVLLKEKEVRIVVDATKELLTNVLSLNPFLIKPNHHELGELFDVSIMTKEEAAYYARKLQQMGAKNVLVSMAGEGAVFVSESGETYESEAPQGTVINSVGAGDSMVAGFLAGFLKTGSFEDAFYMGLCTGSASAFSMEMAGKEQVKALLIQIGKYTNALQTHIFMEA